MMGLTIGLTFNKINAFLLTPQSIIVIDSLYYTIHIHTQVQIKCLMQIQANNRLVAILSPLKQSFVS